MIVQKLSARLLYYKNYLALYKKFQPFKKIKTKVHAPSRYNYY